MPRRRPPREGHVGNNYNLIRLAAFGLLCISWVGLVDAQQQQQRSAVRQRHESPHESLEPESSLPTIEATKIPHQIVETPLTSQQRRKNTIHNTNNSQIIKNDASAIATLAPADTAVAAPPARLSSPSAGLSSPHSARSLEDWEVEDFVLLATVDGKLHARDRKTGKHRWELAFEKPMVETKYYGRNNPQLRDDHEATPLDDFLWIVEPSRDGSLYIYRPPGGPHAAGLVNTGLTMKKLVEEMSPYGNEDPYVMYTGEKKTNMYTVDANTGNVIKFFGTSGAKAKDEGNCANTGFPSEECKNPTLTIGRTEYKVAIQSRVDTHDIATLSFFEWSPNTYDQDLQRQYHSTLDNKYIYTKSDGSIMSLDHDRIGSDDGPSRIFQQKLSSPVVRVFDVARPWNSEKNNPELIILPQPLPPNSENYLPSGNTRESSIFLNHTEDGSWYAMSGKSYPLAVQGTRQAQCMKQDWQQRQPAWDVLNDHQLSEALVGLHSIDVRTEAGRPLTISPGDPNETELEVPPPSEMIPIGEPTLFERFQQLPGKAFRNLKDLLYNPLSLLIILAFVFNNQRQFRAWVGRLSGNKQLASMLHSPIHNDVPVLGQAPEALEKQKEEVIEVPITEEPAAQLVKDEDPGTPKPSVVNDKNQVPEKPLDVPDRDAPTPTPKKMKAHRGRRGGVKHKKGKAAVKDDSSQDGNLPKAQPTTDEIIRDVQQLGQQPKLEPNIHTIPTDPTEVTGSKIRMGALTVHDDDVIGTGSNGTVVYSGEFDGRAVAVKRMLITFVQLAEQETKLLRESDDHPNGTLPSFSFRYEVLLIDSSHPIFRPATSGWLPLHCSRIMPGISG
jgi:serine/threonine-protein kinase/endoribonuclease IRE1